MSTVNQQQRIESALPPDELLRFEGQYPHLLKLMQMNQTVMQQLIVRVGGSGSGTAVVNLDEITADIVELDSLTGSADVGFAVASEALQSAQDSLLLASDITANAQYGELKSMVDQLSASSTFELLIAEIATLRARVEALEYGSNT